VSQATDQESKESRAAKRKLAQALGKIIALVIVVVALMLIERYCTVEVPPFGPDARIVSVDGDTIRAANGAEYRIFGIDAPELHQSCTEANGKSWLCGRAAKTKLTNFISRGNVSCEVRATDRFGRSVAVCSAEGVPDIGEALVRDGYAVDLAPTYPYRDAEAEAREAKRGIWRGRFEMPWEWRAANPRNGD
jgi:endonuclease YncB( thermonuclease family)